MKKLLVLLGLTVCTTVVCAVEFDRGERKISVSNRTQTVKELEIVVPVSNPVLKFAAAELQRFLKQSAGISAPILKKESGKKIALVLGDNALSQKAGLNVKKLASEGFYIKRVGNRIFLAGFDDPAADPQKNRWRMWIQRGTLTAVYDFLERFAGVRFYFPGEMGTVVPKRSGLVLPEKIDIIDRPDLITRENYSGPQSVWYEKNMYLGTLRGDNLNFLRQRYSDKALPFGHGLAYLDLIKRYSKTHPEYFALMPDGNRYNMPGLTHPGHICYSSNITEEIYKDVKAYLNGAPAKSRGLKNWSVNFGSRPYVSIMPQDWLYWCCCRECKKIAPGARAYEKDPKAAQAVCNFMWKHTANVANRLKKDNINGIITQMAYGCLDRLPECDIPDNVAVQVAVKGMGKPEYWADDVALLKKWYAKTKGKVSIWTYPGKHMGKAEMKGLPAMMHRQTGRYLQHVKNYIYGVFLESETDYEIFNYLNYYTFAKIAWNLDTDLDQLLKEHYKLMYGAGAPEMEKFFNELEDLWCEKIIGNIMDSPLGPVAKLPNDFEVWNKIYSPAKLKELNALLLKAGKAAGKDPMALKRIEFIRREMLGPIKAAAEKFKSAREMMNSWQFAVPGVIGLRPYKGDVCDVTTHIRVSENAADFTFVFDCEEPLMKHIKADCKGLDNKDNFMDSCVELFLNPSGNRKNYYHIVVNTNGSVADAAWKRHGKGDYKWNSHCKVNIVKQEKGFKITLVLPKKSIGKYNTAGFPVNFARHRAVKGTEARKVKEIYYQWSPVSGRSFHATERWGVMKLGTQKTENLLKDGSFEVEKIRLPYYVGKWGLWGSEGYKVKRVDVDKKVFMTGTASLHLTNKLKQRISAGQKFKGMKPDTRYRLSFFMRTRNLTGPLGAGGYFSMGKKQFACPTIRVSGNTDWHKRTFEFKTPSYITPETDCVLGLWIWSAAGEAWYDEVSLTEIK